MQKIQKSMHLSKLKGYYWHAKNSTSFFKKLKNKNKIFNSERNRQRDENLRLHYKKILHNRRGLTGEEEKKKKNQA